MLSYFFGKGETKQVENADPEKAMQEALNAHGDFNMQENGTLKFEDLCKLRAVIIRQANRAFNTRRDELNKEKLVAFKAEADQKYVELFVKGQQEYQTMISDWTKKACEWIELDLNDYQITMKWIIENDKEQANELQKLDLEVRGEIDRKEITETRDVFLAGFKLKLQRDFNMQKRLQMIQSSSSQEQMNIVSTVETAKTSDAVMDKFGFDLTHLHNGIKHFELEKADEMQKFAQLISMQQQTELKKLLAVITPSQEEINAMTVEAINLGKPQLKSDATLTFEYFIQASKIQQKYITRYTEVNIKEKAVQRRLVLKEEGKEAEYQGLCQQTAEWERQVSERVMQLFFTAKGVDVSRDVCEKSRQLYMMEPTQRATYEEEMQKVRYAFLTPSVDKLTREQVLNCVRLMEKAKFDAQQKMYELVRRQRLPPDAVNQIIKFEELKAGDLFFNETNIEENEVEPALDALKLKEDPEFLAIIADFEKKSADYLEAKKLETEEMVKKSQHVMTKVEEQAKLKQEKKKQQNEEKKAEDKE